MYTSTLHCTQNNIYKYVWIDGLYYLMDISSFWAGWLPATVCESRPSYRLAEALCAIHDCLVSLPASFPSGLLQIFTPLVQKVGDRVPTPPLCLYFLLPPTKNRNFKRKKVLAGLVTYHADPSLGFCSPSPRWQSLSSPLSLLQLGKCTLSRSLSSLSPSFSLGL